MQVEEKRNMVANLTESDISARLDAIPASTWDKLFPYVWPTQTKYGALRGMRDSASVHNALDQFSTISIDCPRAGPCLESKEWRLQQKVDRPAFHCEY